MKQRLIYTLILLFAACHANSQTTVTGTVTDGREPLTGANVYIIGTIDGCLTDSLGRFSFQTDCTGEVTLQVTYLGFDDYSLTTSQLTDLTIKMHERATSIDEVVVTASTYSFGKSDNFKTMDALDVVMSGNSCGDIVAALQSLPGTQKVGEDGKLYVRGGESDECQTFVNGMHVLVPYSTNTENNAVRGRFSPFLFKGINFSLGGYGGEYGQALSSVLPMETTDAVSSDKLGVSASLVDWNIGGTKAFQNSSLSFNADYTSMGLYNRLFPDRYDWTRPYRKLSGEAQYKADLSTTSVWKTYVGYDLTSVGQHIDNRRLSLAEHNIYANTTFKTTIGKGYSLFAGMAWSSVLNNIDDALVVGGLTVPACHGRQLEMVVRYIAQRGAGQQEPMMTGGFLFYSRGEVQEQFRYDTQLRIEMSRRQVVVEHVSTLFISLRTMTEIIFYPTRHLQHL